MSLRSISGGAAKFFREPKAFMIAFGVVCCLVAGSMALISHAATPAASSEAEKGSDSSAVGTINDPSASGGQAIQFGDGGGGSALKPTDASTGPRIATTDRAGGSLSGSYSGVHFTSSVTINGPSTLTDCIIDGSVHVYAGPTVIDHCDINGWFGIDTDNTDSNLQFATVKYTKIVGATDNDVVRIGPHLGGWGNNAGYLNTLIEDSIIESPFNAFGTGKHFDLLQFGGGRNTTFNRDLFKYTTMTFGSGATSYVNNGVDSINVVFNDFWVEGGPVTYVIEGPVTINNCTMDQTAAYYGFVYPNSGATLNNCFDDKGNPIQSR